MKTAYLKDDAFLADVDGAREQEGLHVWWLGQSGFLVYSESTFVLFDPYLSDSLTRKYAGTDKPHVRITERVIAPERLTFIDIVTSSHNHTDHLDAETLIPLLAANPGMGLIVPEANRQFAAERLKTAASTMIGLNDGESVNVGAATFTGVAAAHEELETDALGRHKFLGYLLQLGSYTIYHSGDTVLYDGLVDRLLPYDIDLALLPINGSAPERRVAGNLNGAEAIRLSREISAKVCVPCHFDMFEFNTAPPELFLNEAKRHAQEYRVLRNGGRFTFTRH